MASQNTINLYKHYLTVPIKARQAAELLKNFPELEEKSKVEEAPEKQDIRVPKKKDGSNNSSRRKKG